MELKGKNVTVLGAGESGLSSVRLLVSKGAHVFLSEFQDAKKFNEEVNSLKEMGIDFEFGGHDLNQIKKSDLIVISPGIPPSSIVHQEILKENLPVWSEIELAYQFVKDHPIIAITGTNGKTTVTTLVKNVLTQAGKRVACCGNIGNSLAREVEHIEPGAVIVLEISSFQLFHTIQFHPSMGVLLNLSVNHLDWHPTFEHYAACKLNLFKNQTSSEVAVLNGSDLEVMKLAPQIHSQKFYFGMESECDNPNFSAVRMVAERMGVDPDLTNSVLSSFCGIEHRLEDVGFVRNIRFINDSKSTTIASLKWALERMPEGVVLIVGGRHKGGDFSVLRDVMKKKASALIAIGECKDKLMETFKNDIPVSAAASLNDAISEAYELQGSSKTVLFSPACASFDMFRNYEDRGHKFKALVDDLRLHHLPPVLL